MPTSQRSKDAAPIGFNHSAYLHTTAQLGHATIDLLLSLTLADMVPPTPVGTPADVAFGTAVVIIGAAALVIMGNGFRPPERSNSFQLGGRRNNQGDLPGAPSSRRARDANGNPTSWPSSPSPNNDDDEDKQ